MQPIRVTIRIPGMTAEQYDRVGEGVRGTIAGSGLIVHAAELTDAGAAITEVWESVAARERWLEQHFRLPPGVETEVEQAELYNVETG